MKNKCEGFGYECTTELGEKFVFYGFCSFEEAKEHLSEFSAFMRLMGYPFVDAQFIVVCGKDVKV
jgi:hypothetical protein